MTYVIWPVMQEMAGNKSELEKLIVEQSGRKDFTLIPVAVENWNDDLSPWKFKDNKNSFAGNANLFLARILEAVDSIGRSPSDNVVIAGYSLAGLFSLWASSQTDVFHGVASCSGSLWFPGFVEAEIFPKCKCVYLSLGDKESKTKHPLMSRVESITCEYSRLLNSIGAYESVFFEMNSGNHFVDSVKRLAKGIAYILA